MRCAAVLLCLSITCPLLAADADHKVVVAHRGASGYLPEHTLEAIKPTPRGQRERSILA